MVLSPLLQITVQKSWTLENITKQQHYPTTLLAFLTTYHFFPAALPKWVLLSLTEGMGRATPCSEEPQQHLQPGLVGSIVIPGTG